MAGSNCSLHHKYTLIVLPGKAVEGLKTFSLSPYSITEEPELPQLPVIRGV